MSKAMYGSPYKNLFHPFECILEKLAIICSPKANSSFSFFCCPPAVGLLTTPRGIRTKKRLIFKALCIRPLVFILPKTTNPATNTSPKPTARIIRLIREDIIVCKNSLKPGPFFNWLLAYKPKDFGKVLFIIFQHNLHRLQRFAQFLFILAPRLFYNLISNIFQLLPSHYFIVLVFK